jgi:hypothetical protein
MEITKLLLIFINLDRDQLNQIFSEIDIRDMLDVCYILDSQRTINLLTTKLKKIKKAQKIVPIINKLEYFKNLEYKTDKTLTKTRREMVKQWSKSIPQEQLDLYNDDDFTYWKKLADIIHFSPSRDFIDKKFLSKCFN